MPQLLFANFALYFSISPVNLVLCVLAAIKNATPGSSVVKGVKTNVCVIRKCQEASTTT